jgi:hypothetical protein
VENVLLTRNVIQLVFVLIVALGSITICLKVNVIHALLSQKLTGVFSVVKQINNFAVFAQEVTSLQLREAALNAQRAA